MKLNIELSSADAKLLLDELWWLFEYRSENGEKKEAALLDLVFQVFQEQVGNNPDDTKWEELMNELGVDSSEKRGKK